MKVAVIQMHVEKDTNVNLENAWGFLADASKQGADLAVLPEMFCCPYDTKNFPVYAQKEGGVVWEELSGMAKELNLYIAAGTVPELGEDSKIYNTAYVFNREGEQIAKHRKMHLFDINITGGQSFKESDTLTPGNQVTVFETEFGKIGLCVCYDIRFPELSRLMALAGAKMVLVPAAFNMTTGPAHWELLFRGRALDNQMYYIGAAPARQVGKGYVSYGNSIVTDPWGSVVAHLGEQEDMALCSIDFPRLEQVRNELPLLAHLRHDVYEIKKK